MKYTVLFRVPENEAHYWPVDTVAYTVDASDADQSIDLAAKQAELAHTWYAAGGTYGPLAAEFDPIAVIAGEFEFSSKNNVLYLKN